MCDCFHVVLPTWPGAPGSVSGRQLQNQEPGVGTEEDYSVTEGPVGEIIRPRPQGSSPVYEYTAEGAGFGAQENNQGRHSSSGRRRSWWKRDSGESTAFSSMSHPESTREAAEVTLKTDVESGASGYTVTGGGDQGIFVKQVLKDSSAARLFSLREGDQLLSATIFFDHMKYEDALKILQYSEPYKVQFRIKRKLSASKGEESAIQQSQQCLKGQEKQDKASADRYMETPTKTLETDGDRERLISKSRDGRQRRPQDRRSWPKFQALRSKRGTCPRRSHSSSEASEHRDTHDVSPTSTDTEAQLTGDNREQKSGSGRRRRRFLNLRFGMSSGEGPNTTEQVDRELQDRQDRAGGLQESKPQEDKAQTPRFMSALTMQKPTKSSHPNLDKEGPGEVKTDTHHRKKKQLAKQDKEKTLGQHRDEPAPGRSWDDQWEEVESLEIGIARLSLQDKPDQGSSQVSQCHGKTQEAGFSQKKKETKRYTSEVVLGEGVHGESGDRDQKTMQGEAASQGGTINYTETGRDDGRESGRKEEKREDTEQVTQTQQIKMKMPKFRTPSFGWSPTKEVTTMKKRQEEKTLDYETMEEETPNESKERKQRNNVKDIETREKTEDRVRTGTIEEEQKRKEREYPQTELRFKMPKFKMPSFSVSAPGKPSLEASLEVAAPKVEADVGLPSVQGDLKTPDLSIQLPSADLEVKAGQVGVKLPEGQLPEGELPAQAAAGAGLKGHLPKVQMPSLKMPKVDLKGPHVDLKGPKVDVKGPKGELSGPEVDVALPGVEVDILAPGAKLDGDLALADKDVAAKDSKFKMPKFKMPSFGVSAPGKPSLEASLEVAAPKVEADVGLPSVQGDLKTPDLSIQLPSADLEVKAGQVGVKLPEGQLPEGELPAQAAAGAGLKGHLPKVQMPSLKMPKVDLKGPHVDLKGPKVDVKGPKGELSGPEVDVALPGVEVDIQAPGAKLEGDLALADKDEAAKDSKFKMPKFKMPWFGVSAPGKPSLEASLEVAAPKVEADVGLPSVQGDLKTPDLSIQLPSADLEVKAGQVAVKLPEGQLPEGELPAQAAAGAGLKGHLPKVQMPSLKMPKVDLKGAHVDLKGPKVDVKGPKVELSGPDVEVSLPNIISPVCSSSTFLGSHDSFDTPVTSFKAQLLFPKFHKPKFVISIPPSSAEYGCPVSESGIHSSLSPSAMSESCAPLVLSSEPPVSPVVEESSIEPALTSPVEASDQEGKGSSFKLPRIKIPPFHWSPKKEGGSASDSESLQVDPITGLGFSMIETDTQIGTCASPVESQQHASMEKETEKGRTRKLSFSLPRLALPKIKGSKGRAAMLQGDVKPSLPGTTAGVDLVVIETTVTDMHVGSTHSSDVTTEPCVISPSMTAGVTGPKADLPLPKDDLDVRGDSKSHLFVGVSASEPLGGLTASITGDLQPSCRQRDIASTMESPEMDPTAKEMSTGSHERWFKMPKFRVPVFRRSSSKEQDGAGEQEATQTQTPAVSVPLETEVAAATVQLPHVPEPKVGAHVSLESPEEGTSVKTPESLTYADVVKRDLHGTGSRLQSSIAGMSETHLSTPELGTHPAKDSFSLEMSGVRVSEPQLPPEGIGGNILAEVEARTGSWSSQPQGPLRLKASLTEMPSQVSVVSTSQLWEDSVLTVTFPKLKVPKFSFQASSSEADVFFPVVREVQSTEASTGMRKDSPGLWGASILKTGAEDPRAPPASLEQSLEASPISKVRVHIQGSQGESQEVMICSRVEREGSDSSAHGAFSTQIVRESEIPASTVQNPSYGFSLLKVKIPEPPLQASVYTVAPDSQVQQGMGGAPLPAVGDIPPDAGEPFEMISSSVGMPPPPPPPPPISSEGPPGPQSTDSTSDEEPAEILEFPEDSQEVKTPEMATKQKSEGKKASLLWSWLPSIGFSSVEETADDSRDTAQRPAPVHVQPAARLDPELPRKQEKAGWFRFPKLGFSSSPTKKSRSAEDEEGQAEQRPQEETITFFDARESFSPEEEEGEAETEVTNARPGSKATVASSARTELVLLEQTKDTGDKSAPRPVAK
ncbi:protein AHNAK2-like [Onychomys torridus]|uniref:protein AHNAK2-like n=1 Tax=Onychomys torridus TaxID=38674 RepID=UPI00167FB1F8|nr:protein AHNAK2-like [Onychomys torridus]